MNRLALLSLFALTLVPPDAALAQAQTTPPTPPAAAAPRIPQTDTAFTLFGGDNFLGVQAEEVTRENRGRYGVSGEPRGVGVRSVVKGSPAERAGLREGDVIVRFDGEPVTSVRKLTRLIDESAPEHAARLTVLRGGSEQQLTATIGRQEGFRLGAFEGPRMAPFDSEEWRKRGEEWKKFGEEWGKNREEWERKGEEMRKQLEGVRRFEPGQIPFALGTGRRIGITTSPLGKQLADYFGVQHGVLVNSVEAGSPADKAGLKAGDVLTEADGEKLDDAGELTRLLNRKEEGEVTLSVVRDKQRRTVRVTPERRRAGALRITPGAVRVVPHTPTLITPRTLRTPVAPRAPRAPRVRVIRGSGHVI